MFRQQFIETALWHTAAQSSADKLWDDINLHYSKRSRHFHNLDHLEHLYAQLHPLKNQLKDWDTLIFSIAYHDIIYNVRKQNNEEQSALYAEGALKNIAYTETKIQSCTKQILATKTHREQSDTDTNYFTDADLSILGADPETYLNYTRQIRKEYRIYPDFLYKPGRAKVLEHFLAMDRIFKTDHFHTLYEEQTRKNLSTELTTLQAG